MSSSFSLWGARLNSSSPPQYLVWLSFSFLYVDKRCQFFHHMIIWWHYITNPCAWNITRSLKEHDGPVKALMLALVTLINLWWAQAMSRTDKQLCYMLSKADWTWAVNHLQSFQAAECRIECSLGGRFLPEPTQVWKSSNRVQPVSDNDSGMEREKEWDLISFLRYIFTESWLNLIWTLTSFKMFVWTRSDPSGSVWNSLGMHAFLVVLCLMSTS